MVSLCTTEGGYSYSDFAGPSCKRLSLSIVTSTFVLVASMHLPITPRDDVNCSVKTSQWPAIGAALFE